MFGLLNLFGKDSDIPILEKSDGQMLMDYDGSLGGSLGGSNNSDFRAANYQNAAGDGFNNTNDDSYVVELMIQSDRNNKCTLYHGGPILWDVPRSWFYFEDLPPPMHPSPCPLPRLPCCQTT